MTAKSYWQSVSLEGERSQDAIRSWFAPLADGMVCDKAELLCDIETDREKKIRAFMTDPQGVKYKFVRTKGRNFSISSERIGA